MKESKWIQVSLKEWNDVVLFFDLKSEPGIVSSTYSVYDKDRNEGAWCAWWDGYGQAVRNDLMEKYRKRTGVY